MKTIGRCVALFALGATYDSAILLWVKLADQGRAVPAALVAMALAASGLTGYDTALGPGPWRWARYTSLVIGYGVGTFAAIALR